MNRMAEKRYPTLEPAPGSLESFYTASYGPLNPEYGELFTGYRVPFERIATETWSAEDRSQLREVTARLSEGTKTVEIKAMSPQVLEQMPKGIGGIEEMRQTAKLTGADFAFHGPMLNPAGFTQGSWSESGREETETRFKQMIERAHGLSPKGNIPVVIHATGVGYDAVPSSLAPKPKGVPITEEDAIYVIDREKGQIGAIPREKKYLPEEKKEVWYKPEEQLEKANRRMWDRRIGSIAFEDIRAGEMIEKSAQIVQPVLGALERGEIEEEKLLPEQRQALGVLKMGQALYDDIGAHMRAFYNDAMKFWPDQTKKEHKDELDQMKKHLAEIETKNLMDKNPLETSRRYDNIIRRFHKLVKENPPKIYETTDNFALEKTRETIANVALHGFKKFGDKAPTIALENFFAGTVFSRGEDLARLIKESREEFIKKAKESGISEGKAKQAAKKFIGATWDLGHIHLLKKHGFGADQQEFKKIMAAESKAIAPFVKHVHVTDNFGFEDSHLPPGMGEIPIKEMLKELEKAGYKGKYVLEAGGLVPAWKTSPTPYALEALGPQIYGNGMQMQPFWNQVRNVYGVPAGYSAGYGMMLPPQHFTMYGSRFADLPIELGGKMPGKGQRFSGTPME